MRGDWALPPQMESPAEVARDIKEVLLEHDGPQMVIFTDNAEREFLGLAVDSDENFVRWLHAPLSHLEREALLTGVQPVRDVFLKRTVLVVDYPHDLHSPQAVWRVGSSDIPETVLPRRGTTLVPEPAPRALAPSEPVLRFAGEGAGKDGVTLSQLGALAGTLHQVFTAIARDVIGISNPSPISVFATHGGSLAVKVHTDNIEIYNRVANQYRDLIRAVDDEAAATRIALKTPPLVIEALDRHLDALDKQRAEMLAAWSSGAVFVGPGSVERARDAYLTEAERPITTEQPREFRGYFEGFWRKKPARFEFYDIDSNDTFTGTVAVAVTRALSNALASLTIGHTQRKYLINTLCQIDPAGDIQGRRLLEFTEIK
jgi:hypothetical protein